MEKVPPDVQDDLEMLRQLGFDNASDDLDSTRLLSDGDLRGAIRLLMSKRTSEGQASSGNTGFLWDAAAMVGGLLSSTVGGPLDSDSPPGFCAEDSGYEEQGPSNVGQPGSMANSSRCAECKTARFFAPYNPHAQWYGLAAPSEWGLTRRHHWYHE